LQGANLSILLDTKMHANDVHINRILNHFRYFMLKKSIVRFFQLPVEHRRTEPVRGDCVEVGCQAAAERGKDAQNDVV